MTPKLVESTEMEKDSDGDGAIAGAKIWYMDGTSQPVHIAGNFNADTRRAQSVETNNELWMKAIALSDGENTRVVMTTDFIRVPVEWNVKAEQAFLEKYPKYGLQDGFLSMSGTHTHSSVDIGDAYERNGTVINGQNAKWHTSNLDGKNKDKETTYYTNYWLPGVMDAVKAALDNLTPATIQTASVAVTDTADKYNVNRVRHWFASDGTVAGTNFGNSGITPMGHIRAADPEMQLIRFIRENEDPNKARDIVLVNWQMHPTGAMSSSTMRMLSADYCGILCNYLNENVEDCVAAYFQGAAGNINAITTQAGETAPNITITATEKLSGYKKYGTYLGVKAAEALQNMNAVPAGKVQSLRNETVVVERGYEEYRAVQQDVIAVGSSVAFVTAGYEMFDSNAMDIKKATKSSFFDVRDETTYTNENGYAAVFVIENSQGHEYMPNWQANHYTLLGGPEAYEVKESQFNEVPGTAEDLADSLIYMLKTLNPNRPK